MHSVISFDPRNILILSFLHTTRCNIWVNLYFSTHPCISEVCGKIPIHPNIASGGVQGRQNKAVIFSENNIFFFKKSGHLDYPLQSYGPKFVNICKYFDSVALAHHPMQYLGELLFFHTPLYIRGVWKNINSPKYYIGWCARATEQSFNFFRK